MAITAIALWCGPCHAIDIAVTGSWSLSVGAAQLAAGAGTDLVGTWESGVSQGSLTISNTTGNGDFWRVDVRRADVSWPVGLSLYVKRSSSGVGGGMVFGGDTYQEVTVSDTSFFIGSGDRTGIDVQLQIGGASVEIPPDTYSTSVVYTVVDTS